MLPPHSRRWGLAVTLWRFTAQLSKPLIRFTAPTVYMGQQQTHHHPRLTIFPQGYDCSYSEYELLLKNFRSYSEYFLGENFKLLKIFTITKGNMCLSMPWHFIAPLGTRQYWHNRWRRRAPTGVRLSSAIWAHARVKHISLWSVSRPPRLRSSRRPGLHSLKRASIEPQ